MPWWAQTLLSNALLLTVSWFAGTIIGKRLRKQTADARRTLWDLLDRIDWAHQRLTLIESRQRGLESTEKERLHWISVYLEEKSGD